ncbi:MAG: hypothetical protein DRP86_02275 [Candidatus Neomarinimicrobiota bacterium]|nr:DUF2884 family protein [Candidatus Neomarinimicrobiota bacterium]RKY51147.1 MAG: hypothetical protein DRP86_02275 [Candidatus Neomarinimicrobiota bacterium]
MRKIAPILFMLLLPLALGAMHIHDFDDMNLIDSNKDLRFSFHSEYVKIYPENRSSENVKIYNDGKLFINGQEVKLNPYEQKLAVEYFTLCNSMKKEIKILVDKAADIAEEAGKIGVTAVAGVLRMLSPFYDAEDFEEDIEVKSSNVKAKADELEKYGDRIEELSDDLNKNHKRLKMRVDALYKLSWF